MADCNKSVTVFDKHRLSRYNMYCFPRETMPADLAACRYADAPGSNRSGGQIFTSLPLLSKKFRKKRYATLRRVLLVTLRHMVQWRHKEVKRYVKIHHG